MRIKVGQDGERTLGKLRTFAKVLGDSHELMGTMVDREREWQGEFAKAEGNRRWRRLKKSTQRLKVSRGQPAARRGYATGALFQAMSNRGARGAYSWVGGPGGNLARVGTNLAYSKWFNRDRRLIPPSNKQHRAFLTGEAVEWLEQRARRDGFNDLVEDWWHR